MAVEIILDDIVVVDCSTFKAFVIDLVMPSKYGKCAGVYNGSVEICFWNGSIQWINPLDADVSYYHLEPTEIPEEIKTALSEKHKQGKLMIKDECH